MIRGQQSIGWLMAVLTLFYGEGVDVLAAGSIVRAVELRGNALNLPPMIAIELSEDKTLHQMLDDRMEKESLISILTIRRKERHPRKF